ncbi:MAG: 2-alkenal reductase, partial [Akkermansiaceae bacterium]|nr:2-alkenal reductase [Akkermansiaceae bacterium]
MDLFPRRAGQRAADGYKWVAREGSRPSMRTMSGRLVFAASFLIACSAGGLFAQAELPAAPPPIPEKLAGAPSDIYRSVVRIEAAVQTPDYATPWNSGRFGGGIGTGFLIGKNKFLTNAHVVSNSRRLLITIHGSPK